MLNERKKAQSEDKPKVLGIEGSITILYYSSIKFVTRFAAMNTSAKDDDEG